MNVNPICQRFDDSIHPWLTHDPILCGMRFPIALSGGPMAGCSGVHCLLEHFPKCHAVGGQILRPVVEGDIVIDPACGQPSTEAPALLEHDGCKTFCAKLMRAGQPAHSCADYRYPWSS
jgi:hypothetical protein